MTFFVTGATGHLGYHLIRFLLSRGHQVHALVLPDDRLRKFLPPSVSITEGNLLDEQSIKKFLNQPSASPRVLIHAASRVTTELKPDALTYDINVNGVALILKQAKQHKIDHLIYVSSVHALKERPNGQPINETFMAMPKDVVGFYAKSKAEATQLVWDAHQKDQLPVSIVYPSGFIGPHDYGEGYTTLMIKEAMNQRMNISFRGGYDFVDVRDVANAIVTIAEKKLIGKTYVLSQAYIPFATLMKTIDQASNHHPFRLFIPMFLIWMALPWMGLYYRLRKKKPLLNRYALLTMSSLSIFDHGLATKDFGFQPRSLSISVQDTIADLKTRA
jgi:dihydroflavonol-4-reductase